MQNVWVKQEEDTNLPEWLTSNIRSKCECGAPIANYYNAAGQITARHCTNPKCPYIMAQKIESMCNILQLKGVGAKTGLKLIKNYNLQSHFEAVPHLWSEKPKISIYNLLRCTFIQGVDTKWSTVADACETVDDIFSKYRGEFSKVLEENKEEILTGAKYFDIEEKYKPQFEPIVTGIVMISGNIKGLDNRDLFIEAINRTFKGLVKLGISKSKRKNGVMALIQEADSPILSKGQCAQENGIPIMTPQEFTEYIVNLLNRRLEDPEIKARVQSQMNKQ